MSQKKWRILIFVTEQSLYPSLPWRSRPFAHESLCSHRWLPGDCEAIIGYDHLDEAQKADEVKNSDEAKQIPTKHL